MSQVRQKLFQEWAELEPDKCCADLRGGFLVGKTFFRAFDGLASDALLRREVQRALTERGWEWQIDLGDPVQASVQADDASASSRAAAPEFPGEALLRAYLCALKRN